MADLEPILVPFLKWAGGKRWLTASYDRLLPQSYTRYIEPFLGSGAVFFHLQPKKAILADANVDLINTYRAIRTDWQSVCRVLRRHQRNHTAKYYYAERSRRRHAAHERAAQFIYLNRTCWNGLYRVNLRGEFNVPIGTKTSVLLDTDEFDRTATLLRKASLRTSDFEPILDQAGSGDFVFIDPPYVTRHNLNGFLKYNETLFTWEDQVRLAAAIRRAARRGAALLLTNADHESVHALYTKLGCAHELLSLRRSSVLAANAAQRGAVTEMALAINYEASP